MEIEETELATENLQEGAEQVVSIRLEPESLLHVAVQSSWSGRW